MKKDSRKSLTFNYNALNLLSVVKENNAVKANYRYLANGTKMSVRNGNGNIAYDYEGSFVYTVTNNTPTLEAAHFTDGQLKATGVNYTLTDHLGSVRAVVDANGTLLERNDYYPFGSRHVNASYVSSDNRYTFSGKESQDLLDLNTYDFGVRMYDGNTARWATVDPLCEDYYSLSLYNYCGNNPISSVDFLGMDYWSTSNPALISLFLNTIRQGDANVYGRSSISFNLSAWEHLTDNDFIAGLSYNDETGMFYWNTANIVNGEWIVTGHSLSNRIYGLPAIKDNQLHFSYYNENKALSASGALINVYPESYIFGGLTKSGRNLYDYIIKSLFRSISTINTFDATKSGLIQNPNREKMGKLKGNTPADNIKQNKQVRDLAVKYKLKKDQVREVHDIISGQGYSFGEIEQLIKNLYK